MSANSPQKFQAFALSASSESSPRANPTRYRAIDFRHHAALCRTISHSSSVAESEGAANGIPYAGPAAVSLSQLSPNSRSRTASTWNRLNPLPHGNSLRNIHIIPSEWRSIPSCSRCSSAVRTSGCRSGSSASARSRT